ncbi:hypothetical protein C8R46DRAFT_827296, partial [Mycena filopes]
MLKCAKKYGVDFNTVNPSNEIKGEIPLWHHFGEDRKKTQHKNAKECVCLRERHNVHLVRDAMAMLRRLQSRTHERVQSCVCEDCSDDRITRGCANPNACIAAIERKLSALLPKWDPRQSPPGPQTTRGEGPPEGFEAPPQITSLTNGFRVLTKKAVIEPQEAHAPPAREHTGAGTSQTVFVASIVGRSEAAKCVAGGGLWYGPDNPKNCAIRVPEGYPQTARTADVVATLIAVQQAPQDQDLKIVS